MTEILALGPAFIDLEGLELTSDEQLLLQRPAVGGIILFSRNFASVSQLRELVAAIRQQRPGILIAVDQEGGRVQRFREGFTRLPALAQLGQLWLKDPQRAMDLGHDTGWLMASELLALGVDFSFAPVVDIDRGVSQVIGDRSFADNAEQVVTLARAMIEGMHEAGMAATLKHFPGHGWVTADSHVAIPVDDRDFSAIEQQDLQPFQQLAAMADAVMPAHVIYSNCDENPAGFSAFWLQSVLRQQLDFHGIVFSDDLTMEAASVAGGYAKRAEQALAAGCNMVLVCNHREGAVEVLDWLEKHDCTTVNQAIAMRGQRQPDWHQLQQQTRWQDIRQRLSSLSS